MTRNNEVSVMKRGNMLPTLHAGTQECFVSPSTDVYETSDAYVLLIDMPGVTKDAVNVTMENGVMSVKAVVERRHQESARLLFNELRPITYYRVFNLAQNIDQSNIDAQYEHGVLTIKLFKKESAKPREIEIK